VRVGFVCMIESIFFLHIIKRNANILRADILAKYLNDDSIGIDIKWLRMNYKIAAGRPITVCSKAKNRVIHVCTKGLFWKSFYECHRFLTSSIDGKIVRIVSV